MNTLSVKDKALIIASLILVFFLTILILMKIQVDKQTRLFTRAERPTGEPSGQNLPASQETPALVTPSVAYQKGVPQEAYGSNQEAGKISILNSPQALKQIKIDSTTPFRKGLAEVIETTLKEMGYSLTIYNRDNLTDEFTLPDSQAPTGSFSSGCNKYGFKWDAAKGIIEVFFFIDQPQEDCSADKFMVPVINAIGQAKGQIFEWWKNGLEKISGEQGRKAELSDFPITVGN